MENFDLFSEKYLSHVKKMREQFFQTGSQEGITGVRSDILACWEAAYLSGLRLDSKTKKVVSPEQLRQAQERSAELIAVAEPYMMLLLSFLEKDLFWVTLMDNNGIILKLIGSSKALAFAESTGLVEGSCRGAEYPYPGLFHICWQLDKPFQIVSTEHPNAMDDDLAGSGAPIHEIDTGNCLGVIGISGNWRKSHDHTMGLAIMTAAAISQQLALTQNNTVIAEANQKLNNALELADAGIVYFYQDGSIYAANQHAINMLSTKSLSRDAFLRNENIFDLFAPTLSPRELDKIDLDKDCKEALICDLIPTGKYAPLHCVIRRVSNQSSEYVIQLQSSSDLNKIATERAIPRAPFSFDDIIGESPALLSTIDAARIAAKHSSSVLITGESGTGKEMFAQAIHNSSPRAKEPFVAINCGAIPKSLIESELFGYEAGAFTGAQKGGRVGKFELANKGTIFLDEIGDMPYEVQVALLRVLQTKELVRVGGQRPIKIDVRVIAATNQNLEKKMEENTFRQDLYYRLNVLNIRLPPLRERLDDLLPLSISFLQKYGHMFDKRVTSISQDVLSVMRQYNWPGNVRELENVIERAVIVCQGAMIETIDLPKQMCEEHMLIMQTMPYKPQKMCGMEQEDILKNALQRHKGNLSEVARELQISRPTVYKMLKKYGLYPLKKYSGFE